MVAHYIEAAEADIARFATLYPMNPRPVQKTQPTLHSHFLRAVRASSRPPMRSQVDGSLT
jgi:hypothetical protein